MALGLFMSLGLNKGNTTLLIVITSYSIHYTKLYELLGLSGMYPEISAVRGSGLFIGVDLCNFGDPAQPAPEITSDIINLLIV